MNHEDISTEYPFEPHFASVHGSNMHYISEGEGLPVVFVHGIPTWSYLWRNIIPKISPFAHCIAPDLIGLGKSDKPDIDYTVFDHIHYFSGFIEALGLDEMILVLHGWGSVAGFEYMRNNPSKVRGVAFYESHVRAPTNSDMLSLPVQELVGVLDSPDGGYDVIMNSNYYVNKVMPNGVLRRLTDEEMAAYQEPFVQPGSCKPIWQYLQEIPLGDGEPEDVVALINRYSQALMANDVPKLMMYAIPGFITTIDTISWARDNLTHLKLDDLGDALHYAQETNPSKMAEALSVWLKEAVLTPTIAS